MKIETFAEYAGFESVSPGSETSSTISRMQAAIQATCDEHQSLLRIEASERAIAHRLAFHLELLIRGAGETWEVDCEYNRFGHAGRSEEIREYVTKRLNIDGNSHDVTPDIVVHRRGERDNELAIEVKIFGRTHTNEVSVRWDLTKLKLFREDENFRYREAVFVLFRLGESPSWSTHRFL